MRMLAVRVPDSGPGGEMANAPTTFRSAESESAFQEAYDTVLAKWPDTVDGVDVPTPYGTTRVNICGPSDGPPVVLLPGAGATSTVWFNNVGALSSMYQVFAVDLMGDYGRTVRDGQPIQTHADIVEWLDAVLTGCEVRDPCLVGHSYGAWIAVWYGLFGAHPPRGIVLLDPTTVFGGFTTSYLMHSARLFLPGSPERFVRHLAWETGGAELDEDWVDLLRQCATDFPRGKLLLPKRPSPQQLRGLTMPTLVLLGERSRAHDARHIASVARQLLPEVETAVIPGATHHTMPLYEPGEINRQLVAFLRQLDEPAPEPS
jgi:pimeloyl-ACP methyl ester carboxylesterase